ncbi:MAG TPA: hypothetical protein VHX86_09895 [Tepidisphaeraceae bacterium]|jgi:hypothetical protein|nr:hypothetical protein [Tepidisphaeraceae bacterium]
MALTRFDRILIDLDYVYAMTVSEWLGEDYRNPAELSIFSDIPHLAPGQEVASITGTGAVAAWNRIISDKQLTIAGSVAFDLSKVCGVRISEDHLVGTMVFRFNDQRGATLALDALAADTIWHHPELFVEPE